MNISDIQEMLGLAASAVGLTKQAAVTVGEVKRVFEDSSDASSPEKHELLNTLAQQLTAANMTNLQLSSLLKEVSEKLRAEDAFEEKRKRYKLVQTAGGDMILQLRADLANDEPTHFVCPICLEKTRQFHFVTGSSSGQGKLCQNCRHFFEFNSYSPPSRANEGGYF